MEYQKYSKEYSHVFCTYFDSKYLARGLSLHSSLNKTGIEFRLYVLCLDDAAFIQLRDLGDESLVPVSLSELEESDPFLKNSKYNRSMIEYYFTCTGSFCHFIMQQSERCQSVTYLDGDLYFYESPKIIFDEIGTASIAIIPHRFSERTYLNRRAGIFNVGWITWKNDDEGRKCLSDYRKNTIKWCYDYFDGRLFADQRYLDTWPVDYRNVCIISHPGANVAPWNLDSAPMSVVNGKVMVGGKPLVFYHFHGHRRQVDGSFERNVSHYVGNRGGLPTDDVIETIYAPYEKLLNSFEAAKTSGSIRIKSSVATTKNLPPWEYQPDGWVDARDRQTGWNVPSAIAALKQRALMIQRRIKMTSPMGGDLNMHNQAMVMAYALARAGIGKHRISALDWQGGVGATFFQFCALLPELAIDYKCFTTPEMMACGKDLSDQIQFFTNIFDIENEIFDMVVMNGKLQSEADWKKTIEYLAERSTGWILILQTPVVSAVPSFVTLRRLFNTDYSTEIQQWAINIRELENELGRYGFTIDREFLCPEHHYVPAAPEQFEMMSFLFKRLG